MMAGVRPFLREPFSNGERDTVPLLVWAATLVAGAFVSLPYALPNDFD
jgi:hypothetical protein